MQLLGQSYSKYDVNYKMASLGEMIAVNRDCVLGRQAGNSSDVTYFLSSRCNIPFIVSYEWFSRTTNTDVSNGSTRCSTHYELNGTKPLCAHAARLVQQVYAHVCIAVGSCAAAIHVDNVVVSCCGLGPLEYYNHHLLKTS